jgi:hypothetical protein
MNESNIFGVSVRALIAFMLVLTVCVMSGLKVTVVEPLYTLCVVAVSFYLGKSTNQSGGSNGQSPASIN